MTPPTRGGVRPRSRTPPRVERHDSDGSDDTQEAYGVIDVDADALVMGGHAGHDDNDDWSSRRIDSDSLSRNMIT